MEFADYPGLNADLAADFHARHFGRRDTHMFPSEHMGQMPHFNPALAGLAVDVKPRLTKEQHDILENEFQKQAKPNTNTKKRFAEILGVSLDKVNNWFQNRRAKSKQDAKKQAGAFNLLQATHQPGYGGMNNSNAYCVPSLYNGLRDMDGPMSSGLGISQAEQMSSQFSLDHMTSQPMRHQLSTQSLHSQHSQHSLHSQPSLTSLHQEDFADNRRTLTQAQFDAFQAVPYAPASAADSATALPESNSESTNASGNDFYPEFCDFSFDATHVDTLASTPMMSSHSDEGIVPASSGPVEADDGLRHHSSSSGSDGSAPSVSITPADEKADLYDLDEEASSQTPATSAQWQPGQSVPVELSSLRQEFQDAALRGREFSMHSIPDVNDYLDQPLAYPNDDDAYDRRDSSTMQLARSMQNITMASQRSVMPSSSIAARRQRPRPAPLGTGPLRSTSYCGALPTSPGPVGGNHTIGGHTLRRIKSSQAINGIANGRIHKSVGLAQRSPSGYATFADAANGNRFPRRVPTFSPAYTGLTGSAAGLVPPTPLSPTDVSRNYASMHPQPMMRQNSSMSDSDNDLVVPSSANFSPPSTPMYPGQYMRNRMEGLALPADSTPPQSAPPTQQCFSSGGFNQNMTSMAGFQTQPQAFSTLMPNEYPQMPNVVYPGQQQTGQYMEMPMSYIMTNTGEVHVGYPVMPSFAQPQMQQVTPPNQQQPFIPSSSLSPGILGSSQVSKQANPAADFFVHEYSPPQDVKQTTTPRKAVDPGPKNYTFSNIGSEDFEKKISKRKGSSSPASSTCGSVTG